MTERATAPRARRPGGAATALLCTVLLSACGGGGGGGAPPSLGNPAGPRPVVADCGDAGQKQFVLDTARDWYRWVDELAPVEPTDYATASEFLAALTAPLAEDFRDPGFSYLTTVAQDQANFATGAFIGFGFRFTIDRDGRYLISDVFESGTAFAAGFVRGAELLAVDRGAGFVTMATYDSEGTAIRDIFGPPEVGIARSFQLRIEDELREISIVKTEIDIPPTADAPRLLERPGLPAVGYFHMRQFTDSAVSALLELFGDFRTAGVTDFVVDLRYNGGGSLDVAERLLNLLGGDIATGRPAYLLRHNDLRADENIETRFSRLPQSVAPNRIAFITTESTASASEVVINSLSPYVEMVLVGSDTLGKAVGQYGFDQRGCGTRLRLVAFEMFNAEGLGEYYTGLVDTGRFTLCAVEEDYRGAFGDANEVMLAGALQWLNSGSCGVAAMRADRRGRSLRRDPDRDPPAARPDRRAPWVQ